MDGQIRRSKDRVTARGAAAALLLLAAGTGGAAAGLEAGIKAFNNGQYSRAAALLAEYAAQGDARAEYLLATLHRLGKGVPRSEYQAFLWYKRAAEDGHLEAQFQLGLMYLRGEGVTADDYAAMDWLWRASEGGYPQAKQVLEYVLHEDFTYGC